MIGCASAFEGSVDVDALAAAGGTSMSDRNIVIRSPETRVSVTLSPGAAVVGYLERDMVWLLGGHRAGSPE